MKSYRPPSEPHPVRDTFAQARKELSSALIERDDEVDLALTALVANEHVLLVGPPGCGKSLLLELTGTVATVEEPGELQAA